MHALLLAFTMVGGFPADYRPGVQIAGEWIDGQTAAAQGIVLTESRSGDFVDLTLENRTGGELRVEEIGWRRRGRDVLSTHGVKAWLGGWQMASPCGLRTADDADFAFDPGYARFAMCEPSDYVGAEKGRFRAEHMVSFLCPDGRICLFGFVTGAERFGHFRLKLAHEGLREFDILCSCDGVAVPPAGKIRSETLAVMYALSSEVQFERFADAWAARSHARRRFAPPVGWCSWYYFFEKVTLADVIAHADWFKTHRDEGFGKVEYLQLDDGYESELGDWLVTNEKFPGGIGRFAAEVTVRGFRPALWVGPFMVSEKSRLIAEHPEWMLHDEGGRILFPFSWRTGKVAVLDATHPEAARHLETLFRTIRSYGIDYVKLDFCMLESAAIGAVYHDRSVTRAGALRRGYEAIRRGFGDDGFILGCTTPFGPAVGLVDAMRSSTDITPYWEPDGKFYDEAPTVPNVCRNVIQRNYMNGRLWINDPDTLIVRDDATKLTEDEVRLWERATELVGGSLMLSDNFLTLSAARLPLVRRALANHGRFTAFPADRWERTVPTLWGTASGDWRFDFTDRHGVRRVSEPLSIMTFNIWGDYFGNPPHERDFKEASVILRLKPDIVALQEVTPNFWKSRLFPELEKGGYAIVRGDEVEAIRRAGGKGLEGFVNHVPLAYRRDRLECVASGYEIFHLKLTDNKGVTWAVLKDRADGRRFIAFSAHFWYQANGDESDAVRELNAKHCIDLFARIKALFGDLPVIGGGDLNSLVGSIAHATFDRAGYRNAHDLADESDGRSSWHGNPIRDAQGVYHGMVRKENDTHFTSLDHVFVEAGRLAVRKHRIVTDQDALDVSDHSPVVVTFEKRD